MCLNCKTQDHILDWAYMGDPAATPDMPDFEWCSLPEEQVHHAYKGIYECNWMQALEGDIDTSHLGFLHLGSVKPEDTKPGTFDYYTVKDRCPQYSVVDTDFGTMYAAWRPAEHGLAHHTIPFGLGTELVAHGSDRLFALR